MYAAIISLLLYGCIAGVEYVFAREWAGLVSAGLLPLNAALLIENFIGVLKWWETKLLAPIFADGFMSALSDAAPSFNDRTLWQET